MTRRPLIMVTNDDGVEAQGIDVLAQLMMKVGDVVVVAPDGPRSGAACSMTVTTPVRLTLLRRQPGLEVYSCSGTPVDCVKLALEHVLQRKPDLLVSGINHGDNASVNVHYSGTMGAVLEACMKGIPAVGFSLRTRDQVCDFSPYAESILQIASHLLCEGLPAEVCLNVNFPVVSRLEGLKVCRMAAGRWSTEWVPSDEAGTYRLTGTFACTEPDATDTDWWAMDHGYGAVVPLQIDMTSTQTIASLQRLFASHGQSLV